MQKTPDNTSIDFTPTSVEDAAKVASPAEYAAHMEALGDKFLTKPQESTKRKPDDLKQIENLVASLETRLTQEKKIEIVATEPTSMHSDDSVLRNFVGEGLHKTVGQVKEQVLSKESENAHTINKGFFPKTLFPAAVTALVGVGAWAAAGSGVGIGASVAGIPLMTAVALGAAPLAATILVLGGATWAIRRLMNSRKANKALAQV